MAYLIFVAIRGMIWGNNITKNRFGGSLFVDFVSEGVGSSAISATNV